MQEYKIPGGKGREAVREQYWCPPCAVAEHLIDSIV